ncbi:hypothetical protein [Bordetella bronchialis]|uniref:Uncharacterized protein n=1 Tax=Bordetella bronchialis TaxID=463025 RepID=A0ABN4R0P5_9BORD|nr:hypothetical protein [Bordetella bronchialis]ANN66812.1 hypothetical protein BAU06_11430 [Bordetella bronchialis]
MSIDTLYSRSRELHTPYAPAAQAEISDSVDVFSRWRRDVAVHDEVGTTIPDNTSQPPVQLAPPTADAFIRGIDWTTALGPVPGQGQAVYYDGLTLRNAGGKPMTQVVEDLESRIGAVLRARGVAAILGAGDCVSLERRVRRTMIADPTLSLHPPPDVRYGGPRWLAIWTAIRVLEELGLSSHDRSVDDLVAIGRAEAAARAQRNTVTSGGPGPAIVTPRVDLGALLLMSHAAGTIDLHACARSDATIAPRLLIERYRDVFADDLRFLDLLWSSAHLQLSTGAELARGALRAAGIDPDHRMDGQSAPIPSIHGPLRLKHPSPPAAQGQRVCDFYLSRGKLEFDDIPRETAPVSAPDSRREPAQAARIRALLALPLQDQFNSLFSAQATLVSQYTAALIDASISRYGKQYGIDFDNAAITVSLARPGGPEHARPQGGNTGADGAAAFTFTSTSANDSRGYFVAIETPAGSHVYFLSWETGTELALPADVGIHEWARQHRDLVFGSTGIGDKGTQAPAQDPGLLVRTLASGTRSEIVAAITAKIMAAQEAGRAAAYRRDEPVQAQGSGLERPGLERPGLEGPGLERPGPDGPGLALAPLRAALRAISGGHPHHVYDCAAMEVLILAPGIREGITAGSGAAQAFADEIERAFAEVGSTHISRIIGQALAAPRDLPRLLRGGGRLTSKGVEILSMRLKSARPGLAKELTRAIETRALSPYGLDSVQHGAPATVVSPRAGATDGAATSRTIDADAARRLDRKVPDGTPNYRGAHTIYDAVGAYAYDWWKDGDFAYTGFLADTPTVALAMDILRHATDLSEHGWWKNEFDEYFDIRVLNLEKSAYRITGTDLADASAAAGHEAAMRDALRTFLASVYASSETFRGLANDARAAGRLGKDKKWRLRIAAPDTISQGRSTYAGLWPHVDFASRTAEIPDVQAPPEGSPGSTLTDSGAFAPADARAVVLHEILHILTAKGDPPVGRWDNDPSLLARGFPERGPVEYLTQRILKECGIDVSRRLCYLHLTQAHRDVVRDRIPLQDLGSLQRYVDMQDEYLSKVFPNRIAAPTPVRRPVGADATVP